jgi:hypothetical protein
MKNLNDPIEDRARDFLSCSAVPQPIASPCNPSKKKFCFLENFDDMEVKIFPAMSMSNLNFVISVKTYIN